MKKRIITLALPTLLATCAVQADLVLEYLGYGRGGYERMSVDGHLAWDETSGSETFWDLRTYEHLWASDDDVSYLSQCIQIYASIDQGAVYDWAVGGISESDVKTEVLEDLYARWVNPYTGGVQGSESNDDIASAFQIMIWEITHENFDATTPDELVEEISFSMGAIQWDAEGGTAVEEYVYDMHESLGEGGWLTAPVDGWYNDYAQNQASYLVIPAPAAVAGLVLGMAGIVRRRRR